MKTFLLCIVATLMLSGDCWAGPFGIFGRNSRRGSGCGGNEGGNSGQYSANGCNGGAVGYGGTFGVPTYGYSSLPAYSYSVPGVSAYGQRGAAKGEKVVSTDWLGEKFPEVLRAAEAAGVVKELPPPPPVILRSAAPMQQTYYLSNGVCIGPNCPGG